VLDLVFVQKNEDGSVSGLALMDLDADGDLDLVQFDGASSGLLGQDDYDEAVRRSSPAPRPRSCSTRTAGRVRFVKAVKAGGAQLVASGRLPAADLADAVETLETASA